MKIKEQFSFLQEYKVFYKEQVFNHVFNTNFTVFTYSFYNKNGCFTIYNLPQRGEVYYYMSTKIEDNLIRLMDKEVNIFSMYPKIFDKHKSRFFYSFNKEIKILSEILKIEIVEKGEFFGIKLE